MIKYKQGGSLMSDDLVTPEQAGSNKRFLNEQDAIDYFLGLKTTYETQRQPWEHKWEQALSAVYMTTDLDKVYEGRAQVNSPIMKWKVRSVSSRLNKVLFNTEPFGRLEDSKVTQVKEDVIDLWNAYIFDHQLDNIGFKPAYKMFTKSKIIQGTAVAKVTQEFEEKEVNFFGDEEKAQTVTVKDDTLFLPMILTEFYSDVNKFNIQESAANIHSTEITMEELIRNRKHIEVEEFEEVDPATGEVVNIVEERKEAGIYHNLELLDVQGANMLSEEQERYVQLLGFNKTSVGNFKKGLKDIRKTGVVKIDECYGKYFIDGEEKEVICTIANSHVVIRLEETPFIHKRLVRPFIVGRAEPILNCLYGDSNVMAGHNLLKELNATRGQAVDAKTRSVAPMWYMDTSRDVVWDKVWRPDGQVKGNGPNGMTPLLNPYLGNVTIQDSVTIQRDLDQLWSISPVQEGTSDGRLIPQTAAGTMELISQNDMPLNDMIDDAISYELKPFIEMIYERNLTFKTAKDLLVVWTEEEIQNAGLNTDMSLEELMFDFNVKILGSLELANEMAHQQGYQLFMRAAAEIPPVARRVNWELLADKLLKSFGIKDDAKGIFLDEKIVAKIIQEEQKAEQEAVQAQEQQRQQLRGETKEDYEFKKVTDTEAKIVEMQSEAAIEKGMGVKVQ